MSDTLVVTPPMFRFKPKNSKALSVFLAGSIEMGRLIGRRRPSKS
jgi:P pilus assembly chaperone PapD